MLVPERLLPCFYHYIAYIAFSALAVSPLRKGLHDGGCKDFSGSVYRALALASPAGVCGVPTLSQIDATGGFNVSWFYEGKFLCESKRGESWAAGAQSSQPGGEGGLSSRVEDLSSCARVHGHFLCAGIAQERPNAQSWGIHPLSGSLSSERKVSP